VDTPGFIVFNRLDLHELHSSEWTTRGGFKPTGNELLGHEPRTGWNIPRQNSHHSSIRQRSNLFLAALSLVRDILPFQREALGRSGIGPIHADTTWAEYLRARVYTAAIYRSLLDPMALAIWSMSLADMLAFPLAFFGAFSSRPRLAIRHDALKCGVINGGFPAFFFFPPPRKNFLSPHRDPAPSGRHPDFNCPVQRITREMNRV